MPRVQHVPLSDALVTIRKGEAAPAPDPDQHRDAPVPNRVAITFRLTEAAHEWLRLRAFETRKTKQAIVDEMFASCMVDKNHGS